MKNDIRVSNFSFHNVAKTVAQLTLPDFDALTLHQWWTFRSEDGRFPLRHQCVNYAMQMITSFEAVVEKVDSFGKSATMAQVFGLEWFASFSRGSQFFVEALLCRAARRLGFLLLTASKKQVGHLPWSKSHLNRFTTKTGSRQSRWSWSPSLCSTSHLLSLLIISLCTRR